MDGKILILIQGPLFRSQDCRARNMDGSPKPPDGRETPDVLKALNDAPNRDRFFVAYALWEDAPEETFCQIAQYVDKVIPCRKPLTPGSCHRNYQTMAVHTGLMALRSHGFRHALKTRSDMVLSQKFLDHLVELADSDFNRILVTNLFTRYESFHISDMIVFSTYENLANYYLPSNIFYEDLYSPEVQFARTFIRVNGLPYTMRQMHYLEFLRDWVALIDFNEYELVWLKEPGINVKETRRYRFMIRDRDCGPVLTRLVTTRFHRFLCKTRIPRSIIAHYQLISDAIMRLIVCHGRVFGWMDYMIDQKAEEWQKKLPGAFDAPALFDPAASANAVPKLLAAPSAAKRAPAKPLSRGNEAARSHRAGRTKRVATAAPLRGAIRELRSESVRHRNGSAVVESGV